MSIVGKSIALELSFKLVGKANFNFYGLAKNAFCAFITIKWRTDKLASVWKRTTWLMVIIASNIAETFAALHYLLSNYHKTTQTE